MSAVPLVQDDRFWPDNLGCEILRKEVEAYLDVRAVASEHAVEPAIENRRIRHRVRRRSTVLRRRHHGSKYYGCEGTDKSDHPRLKALRTALEAEIGGEIRVPVKFFELHPAATREPRAKHEVTSSARNGEVVVKHEPCLSRRRVFDPALEDQRAEIRAQLTTLEVRLVHKLRARERRPIERQITNLRERLRGLDTAAVFAAV